MSIIQYLSRGGQKVYQFLIKAIQEGRSATETLKILREQGLGYRTQDFYNDWRILSGAQQKWDTMKYVRRDRVISPELYEPSGKKLMAEYYTIVRARFKDELTGEIIEKHITVMHDTPLRRSDIEMLAQQTLEGYAGLWLDRPYLTLVDLTPVRGYRSA